MSGHQNSSQPSLNIKHLLSYYDQKINEIRPTHALFAGLLYACDNFDVPNDGETPSNLYPTYNDFVVFELASFVLGYCESWMIKNFDDRGKLVADTYNKLIVSIVKDLTDYDESKVQMAYEERLALYSKSNLPLQSLIGALSVRVTLAGDRNTLVPHSEILPKDTLNMKIFGTNVLLMAWITEFLPAWQESVTRYFELVKKVG